MRLLVDSNVIITLEDSSRALEPHYARLTELCGAHGHQLLIHPASRTDLNRDENTARRQITESRFRRHPVLDSPPRFSPEISLHDLDNDGVDRELLYAVERDAVAILVTEDRGIHRKAKAQGIAERVHYVQQAVSWLERLHAVRAVAFHNIRDVPIHNFVLSDPFFDSLRAGYIGFDDWFRRSAQSGRRAWAYVPERDTPSAICIYKREDSPVVTDAGVRLEGPVLKLCTFKVGKRVRGRKVGELLFKAAFTYASRNGMEFVYLTTTPDQGFLRDLCAKYGFVECGACSQGREIVLVKEIPRAPPPSPLPPLEYHIKFSPCIKVLPDTQVLLIPIQPNFHNQLFPEISSQFELFSDPVIGNGLTLAYLCHARLADIHPGDVALFYRSGDLQSITTVGVVESSFISNDVEVIVRNVAKRTVYSLSDIARMAAKPVRVILFRLASHLAQPVAYDQLLQRQVLTGPVQSIRRISVNDFREITRLARIPSCLFAYQTEVRGVDPTRS